MNRYQSLYEAKETYGIDLGMMYKVPEHWFGHKNKAIVPGEKVVEMIEFLTKIEPHHEVERIAKGVKFLIKPLGHTMPKELGNPPMELYL